MYAGPWRQLKDCRFIDWPACDGEQSIHALADRLIGEYRIHQNDILIGSSLGGMVGLEICEIVKSPKVVLIGSALNPGEISFVSKALIPLAGRCFVKASQFISSLSGNSVLRMYSKSDTDFIVAMSKAMLHWEGFRGDLKKVARIHGRQDRLIRCPVDSEIIEDGGHLIAVTHPQECVEFILKNSE